MFLYARSGCSTGRKMKVGGKKKKKKYSRFWRKKFFA